MSLEKSAVYWLRFKRGACVILLERWPLCARARPDVFGVTRGRQTIEVEIKRTMNDFRANARKFHVANRDNVAHQLAHFTYFLVPNSIEEKVMQELPEWAGLLIVNEHEYDIKVRKRAPMNKMAKKLSLNKICHLGLLMGSQLYSHIPPGPRFPCEMDYEI